MFLFGYFSSQNLTIFKYCVINTHNLCWFWNKEEERVYFVFALGISAQNMKLYTIDIHWF